MDWQTVLSIALLAGMLAAGLVWLGLRIFVTEHIKQSVKSEFDQKLEAHKAQLASQSAIEVGRLKSQLAVAAAERNARFVRLHEKRADVVAEVYKLVKELHSAVLNYVSPMQVSVEGQSDEERTQAKSMAAAKAMGALRSYFPPMAIYIPKATAEKIEQLLDTYSRQWFAFRYQVQEVTDAERYRRWQHIAKTVEGLNSSALAELEDEFRRLLGDSGTD